MSAIVQGIEQLKVVDDLDTRREVFYLLQRLNRMERKMFLEWAMKQTNTRIMTMSNPPHVLVKVTLVTDRVDEAFYDLWMMVSQYGLPLQDVLQKLEKFVGVKDGKRRSDQSSVWNDLRTSSGIREGDRDLHGRVD